MAIKKAIILFSMNISVYEKLFVSRSVMLPLKISRGTSQNERYLSAEK